MQVCYFTKLSLIRLSIFGLVLSALFAQTVLAEEAVIVEKKTAEQIVNTVCAALSWR